MHACHRSRTRTPQLRVGQRLTNPTCATEQGRRPLEQRPELRAQSAEPLGSRVLAGAGLEYDAAMEKTMSDPALHALFEAMPLDGKRLIFAGFEEMMVM